MLARDVDSGALDLHALLQSTLPVEHGPIRAQQARAVDLKSLQEEINEHQAVLRPDQLLG